MYSDSVRCYRTETLKINCSSDVGFKLWRCFYQHWCSTSSAVSCYLSIVSLYLLISLSSYSGSNLNHAVLQFSWNHFPKKMERLSSSSSLVPAGSTCRVGNKASLPLTCVFLHVALRAPFPPRYWVRELRVLFLQRDRSGVHHTWQGERLVWDQTLCDVCGVCAPTGGMKSSNIASHAKLHSYTFPSPVLALLRGGFI